MSDNSIQIKTSTINTTPATLKFGELALSSIGAVDKLYIGNSSLIPQEVVMKNNNVQNITWTITSSANANQNYQPDKVLFINLYPNFFNVELCTKPGLGTIYNQTRGEFTILYTGFYIITVSINYADVIDGLRTRIIFNRAGTPAENDYYYLSSPGNIKNSTIISNTTISRYCIAGENFYVKQEDGQSSIFLLSNNTYATITYLGSV